MDRRFLQLAFAGIFALTLLSEHAADAHTSTRAQKCVAAKLNLTGKKILALAVCEARAARDGIAVRPSCEAKAKATFMLAWARAEARAKGNCITIGDAGAIESTVDQLHVELKAALGSGNASKCRTAAKFKAVGRDGACKLRCSAKGARDRLPPRDPTIVACLTTCNVKLGAAFTKTPPDCPSRGNGSGTTVDTRIDMFVMMFRTVWRRSRRRPRLALGTRRARPVFRATLRAGRMLHVVQGYAVSMGDAIAPSGLSKYRVLRIVDAGEG